MARLPVISNFARGSRNEAARGSSHSMPLELLYVRIALILDISCSFRFLNPWLAQYDVVSTLGNIVNLLESTSTVHELFLVLSQRGARIGQALHFVDAVDGIAREATIVWLITFKRQRMGILGA